MAGTRGFLIKVCPHIKLKDMFTTTSRCLSCSALQNDRLLKPKCDTSIQSKHQIQFPAMQLPFSSTASTESPFGGGKSLEYSERRVLGYSMAQMYDIVSAVDKYTEFVPWCKSAAVHKRQGNHFKAEMTVGFPPVKESYTCIVTASRPYLVRSEATNGFLFNYLVTTWRFSPGLKGQPNTCTLDFAVSFEFRSRLHSHLATIFFDEVVKTMVRAFLKRARRLYGEESGTNLPSKVVTYSNH